MNTPEHSPPPLNEQLLQRVRTISVTYTLMAANILVFIAMLASGSGLWHSSQSLQLAWGANFAPATQDGQWWRLGSAMFLHFGVLHLLMNMAALWDGGKLAERMYGHARFLVIYLASGLLGNLLSLTLQGSLAVSGGASGAIFGVYGSLLVFLWVERGHLDRREFRWMFWGASLFSGLIIMVGFVVPAINNAAHIGGFITGLLFGGLFVKPAYATAKLVIQRVLVSTSLLLAIVLMIANIPQAAYRWRDEVNVRKELKEFQRSDQEANRNWLEIVNEGKKGEASFDELAGRIDSDIADRYAESFEELSKLPLNPAMPSAKALQNSRAYAQQKRDASRALADHLREQAKQQ